jgi:lambda repressor-like predicted transcriptional regulator
MHEVGIPSLASLSSKSSLSQATIDRIMNRRSGKCNTQTVQLLADALKCEPKDLFTEEALTEGTALANAGAVADAIAEAVNAVVSDVAPDVAPQEIAEAIPDIKVSDVPPVGPFEFFEHIKSVHEQELAQLHAAYKRHVLTLYSGIGILAIALFMSIIW